MAGAFSDQPVRLTAIAGDWDQVSPVSWESAGGAGLAAQTPVHPFRLPAALVDDSPARVDVMGGTFSLAEAPLPTMAEASGLSAEDVDALSGLRAGLVADLPAPAEHQAGLSTGAAAVVAVVGGVYWFARRRAGVAAAGDDAERVDPLVFMLRHRPAGAGKGR
jgi:hypothetical protein